MNIIYIIISTYIQMEQKMYRIACGFETIFTALLYLGKKYEIIYLYVATL